MRTIGCLTGGLRSISAWVGGKARLRPVKSNTARRPSMRCFIASGRASYAAAALANSVSPSVRPNRSGISQRVEHRPARRPRRVAHVAVPVLAGAADADRPAVLGHVGDDDDLRAAGHAPALAENVEFDLAEAAGEGDLLRGRDSLVAEEDDAMLVIGALDRGEGRIVERPGQIDAADLGAERGAGGDYFNRH